MATVLIVDDEKNIREHLATYVRSLRHRAEVAAEATAALALLEQHEPDVIFSDVRMAGMDGLALLREIRRRRPDAVVRSEEHTSELQSRYVISYAVFCL